MEYTEIILEYDCFMTFFITFRKQIWKMAHFQTPFLGSWNQNFFWDPVVWVIYFHYLSPHIGQSRRWGGCTGHPSGPWTNTRKCQNQIFTTSWAFIMKWYIHATNVTIQQHFNNVSGSMRSASMKKWNIPVASVISKLCRHHISGRMKSSSIM